MGGRKNFRELRAKLEERLNAAPPARARVEQAHRAMCDGLPLVAMQPDPDHVLATVVDLRDPRGGVAPSREQGHSSPRPRSSNDRMRLATRSTATTAWAPRCGSAPWGQVPSGI